MESIKNTKDAESLGQLESLLGALKGLHTGRNGHSKDIGGLEPDDSDYEQQVSGGFDTEQDDDCDFDEDELDYDFEQDYEDNIRTTKKLDFRKGGVSIMSDKRQRRKVDDLLRDELENILPLWRSGAIQDGDGASRRFASRAKGYDIYDSDDDFLLASSVAGGKQKKKKNSNKKKEPHGGSFETLMDLNRQIEHFVKDRSSDNLHLPPMPKPLRRKIHLLCNHYNLKSESVGSGKRRYPILIKTDRTKMPINPVNVNKLLNQSENELKALSIQFQGSNSRKSGYEHGNGNNGNSGGGRGGQGGYKDNRNNKKGRNSGSSMAVPGSIVGASASAISVDNVGHRMLSKLGWTPGVGLGATGEGITQPIEAIIRAKNRGLGHE
ncbi:hypothetical protein BCR41DRAFT_206667 [Lobosporangium transversale]|uniref:Protein SQS1 n=1 Tax=Lobosporangium transversale TaxID=64571 RepID=A0A1Y2G890_9FUNG|nr:hypothetical protein BCR41DRAFT_206667 [Lobosporangium transversale]ORZ04044.1 hypothetical protein BCR41DRAFT_206667 [Lobosporangium transversale]|eukprot:XP_021876321.1 hypothetical protein BCR41DRAFT_206667 [Lobosporangium transversale]